ncbi:hypothetical protein AADQ00_05880 [Escherichia coli]|uniref:hypothetical protein n=1 Tax=Enterobacteriaceae TaxID=543 RepID=UPI0003DD6EE0|nr:MULTISPECIES: hypothetical protein [Enterobacteriaceae]CDK48556.1 hypothetical protein [Escherichia coli IS1]HCJ7771036.1 hypothetical protein [Citrobacter freundii]EEV5812739.1 hypothetical protein [Escherichia coli]EFC1824365.1 hypothetical protein [Escherichia coli]EFF2199008.1 hypothetical protein [Escherichia coli]
MNNLPRLGIKRAFEEIIQNELKLKYVQDAFTTGVKKEIQVMIPEMTEEYTRIQMQSKLGCTLNMTIDIFSEINETGVHKAVYDLISITAIHPKLREFKINKIYPSSSFTSYNNESSNGQVSAQVVLTLEYLM